MGTIPDDMGGIFDHLREAALTMQQGGGIGYDFSTLRPRGAPVKGVGADASGPLSFMDVWDAMCRTIMSAGHRRGAMMATMRCDHPDIEAFIEAKRAPGRLRMFNLSVLVTDAFMAAVREDAPWELELRRHDLSRAPRARALGQDHAGDLRLCRARRDLHRPHQPPEQPALLREYPGDESLRRTATSALWRLPARLDQSRHAGASIPSSPSARLDLDRLGELVATAVRMMDDVIDVSHFPLPQQDEEAARQAAHRARRHRARRCAHHVRGALRRQRCGGADRDLDAGAARARPISPRPRSPPRRAPSRSSIAINFWPARSIRELEEDVRDGIAHHGIRNALLTSIAPTGTISLFADNISSGLEPVFSFKYTPQHPDARRQPQPARRSATTPTACSAG